MIEDVGVAGVGAMGREMGRHMLEKRFKVHAYDISAENLSRMAELGAKTHNGLKALAAATEATIVMVATEAQVREVVAGLIEGAGAGHVIVVSSSVNPHLCEALAEEAARREVVLLDGPVVFGLQGAIDGRLKTLLGGPTAAVERVRRALSAYCAEVIHVGERVGMGQLAKTINNMLHWSMVVANYEALELGERFGLHPERLRDVLLKCPATNGTLATWLEHRLTWWRKDMETVLSLAREVDLSIPLHGLVDQLMMPLTPEMTHGLILKGDQSGAK